MEEISTAAITPAQALGGPLSVSSLHPFSLLIGDLFPIFGLMIIECELFSSLDVLHGKEGELVNIAVSVVVGDGIDGAVRLARVVDEARGAAHMHAVDGICWLGVGRIHPEFFALFVLGDLVFATLDLLFQPGDLVGMGVEEFGLGNRFTRITEFIEAKHVVVTNALTDSCATIGFVVCNDLTSVRIDERTFQELDWTAQT